MSKVTNDFIAHLRNKGLKVVDRRNSSLGRVVYDRNLSQLKYGGQHWTASANSHISNHESYWKSAHGWGRGGYTAWVDNDGTINVNYPFEMRTWGIGGNNTPTLNFCYEGIWSNPMTSAQKKSLMAMWAFVVNDSRIPNINSYNKVLGHNEFAGHTNNSCPGINMNTFRADLKGNKVPKATSSASSVAGATKLKDETAKFTTKVAIKVRNTPSTSAKHTGTLPKGTSIIYDSVFKGNGYRWLSYIANSGNRLYVPYRPENDKNANWGTFTVSDKDEPKKEKEKEKVSVTKDEKLYKVQTGSFSNKDNAKNLADKLEKDGYDTYIAEEDK